MMRSISSILICCSSVSFYTNMNQVDAFQVSSLSLSSSIRSSFNSLVQQQQQQQPQSRTTTKTTFTPPIMMMVRRGKGSIGKEVGTDNTDNSSNNGSGMGANSSTSTTGSNINWTPISVSVSSLPKEENQVTLIDTNLITLKNGQTNPTGAVSVIQYQQQTYCFEVNCPSCKIPLIKAQCIPNETSSGAQPPLLQCDLCKATYNIKTGEKVSTSVENQKIGIMGTIVKSIFSSQASGPLKVYKLGEKNGKLLIAGLD
jgi:nitrite reductase/ring-hydroxylating ferredoxin subunit